MKQTEFGPAQGSGGMPSLRRSHGVSQPLSVLWPSSHPGVASFPQVSMTRSVDSIHLTAFLPGVEKEELELSVEKRDLILSGNRVLAVSNEEVLLEERFFGSFKRVIRLPELVDLEQVEAKLEDGVLSVTLPRLKSNLKTAIEIK